MLLALAEAENLRTRFARESQQTKKFAIQVVIRYLAHFLMVETQGFVQDLLGCLDNLDRAVDSVPKEVDAAVEDHRPNSTDLLSAMNGLLSGVRMTQKDFRNVTTLCGRLFSLQQTWFRSCLHMEFSGLIHLTKNLIRMRTWPGLN